MQNYIKQCAHEVGFSLIGITDTDLSAYATRLNEYLEKGQHATMAYLEKHNPMRLDPKQLMPEVNSIICCALNYWPDATSSKTILADKDKAYVSRYALGRDYHKVMRKKLEQLAQKIKEKNPQLNYRCFVDSGPVLEKALAIKAGLGWQGKNSLLLNNQIGSYFFLGEIYIDLELINNDTNLNHPVLDTGPRNIIYSAVKPRNDGEQNNHCGNCKKCLNACPTKAITAPYQIDAKRCIAYLTLEYKGIIPEEMRPLIGNRIYGCDDCQLCCPWNRFAKTTQESDFAPRNNLDNTTLIKLFTWSEEEFLKNTEGSAIRRIGYECWQRNIAVALGNATSNNQEISKFLKANNNHPSDLVLEHLTWAINRHRNS